MTHFLVICIDKKNSLNRRLENREQHLKHLKSLRKKLLMAGPILDEKENPVGSLLIIDFKKKIDLQKFLENDPYSKADLFKTIKIEKFKRVF